MSKFKKAESGSGRAKANAKGQNGTQVARKEEVGKAENNEQPVKSPNSPHHKAFETHIAFLRAEHDLNAPAVGIISQNRIIIQRKKGILLSGPS